MVTLKIRACRIVQEEASERAPERRSLAGFRRVRRGPRRTSCARCGGPRWWVRGRRKTGPHRPHAWRGDECARRGLAAPKLNEMLNGPGPAGRPRPGRVVAAGRGHAAGAANARLAVATPWRRSDGVRTYCVPCCAGILQPAERRASRVTAQRTTSPGGAVVSRQIDLRRSRAT